MEKNSSDYGCLRFLKGGSKEQVFKLTNCCTIGSALEATIRLKINSNSHQAEDVYCAIELEGETAVLKNRAVENPVKINGEAVIESKILSKNDVIEVLGKKFRYEVSNEKKDYSQKIPTVTPLIGSWRMRKSEKVFSQRSFTRSKIPVFNSRLCMTEKKVTKNTPKSADPSRRISSRSKLFKITPTKRKNSVTKSNTGERKSVSTESGVTDTKNVLPIKLDLLSLTDNDDDCGDDLLNIDKSKVVDSNNSKTVNLINDSDVTDVEKSHLGDFEARRSKRLSSKLDSSNTYDTDNSDTSKTLNVCEVTEKSSCLQTDALDVGKYEFDSANVTLRRKPKSNQFESGETSLATEKSDNIDLDRTFMTRKSLRSDSSKMVADSSNIENELCEDAKETSNKDCSIGEDFDEVSRNEETASDVQVEENDFNFSSCHEESNVSAPLSGNDTSSFVDCHTSLNAESLGRSTVSTSFVFQKGTDVLHEEQFTKVAGETQEERVDLKNHNLAKLERNVYFLRSSTPKKIVTQKTLNAIQNESDNFEKNSNLTGMKDIFEVQNTQESISSTKETEVENTMLSERLDNSVDYGSIKKTPKTKKDSKNDLTDVSGVKYFFRTPKVTCDSCNLTGIENIFNTEEKAITSPMKENKPSESSNNSVDYQGVKKLLRTPKIAKDPKNDLSDVTGVKYLLRTPKVVQNESNNCEESCNLTGIKDIFEVQDDTQENISPCATKETEIKKTILSERLDNSADYEGIQKLLRTPKTQKNPKNDLTDVDGVKHFFRTPKVTRDSCNQTGIENTLETQNSEEKIDTSPMKENKPSRSSNDSVDYRGVKKLLRTPKIGKEPKNDLSDVTGVKYLLRTPKVVQNENNNREENCNLTGIKEIFEVQNTQESEVKKTIFSEKLDNSVDYGGIKKLLQTPKNKKDPKNDLTDVTGVKYLLRTPKVVQDESSNLTGIKEIFEAHDTQENISPCATKETEIKKTILSERLDNSIDYGGIKKLLQTPKNKRDPKNDLTDVRGVKYLLRTPKAIQNKSVTRDSFNLTGIENIFETQNVEENVSSRMKKNKLLVSSNDSVDYQGVKKLLRTPKIRKDPKNDLSDVTGVKYLLRTPKVIQNKNANHAESFNLTGMKDIFEVQDTEENVPSNSTEETSWKSSQVENVEMNLQSKKNDTTETKNSTTFENHKDFIDSSVKQSEQKCELQENDTNSTTSTDEKEMLNKTEDGLDIAPIPSSPKNDLIDVHGVKQMFATEEALLRRTSPNVSGVEYLFSTATLSEKFDLINDSKPTKKYKGKSSSVKKMANSSGVSEDSIIGKAYTEKWLCDQMNFVGNHEIHSSTPVKSGKGAALKFFEDNDKHSKNFDGTKDTPESDLKEKKTKSRQVKKKVTNTASKANGRNNEEKAEVTNESDIEEKVGNKLQIARVTRSQRDKNKGSLAESNDSYQTTEKTKRPRRAKNKAETEKVEELHPKKNNRKNSTQKNDKEIEKSNENNIEKENVKPELIEVARIKSRVIRSQRNKNKTEKVRPDDSDQKTVEKVKNTRSAKSKTGGIVADTVKAIDEINFDGKNTNTKVTRAKTKQEESTPVAASSVKDDVRIKNSLENEAETLSSKRACKRKNEEPEERKVPTPNKKAKTKKTVKFNVSSTSQKKESPEEIQVARTRTRGQTKLRQGSGEDEGENARRLRNKNNNVDEKNTEKVETIPLRSQRNKKKSEGDNNFAVTEKKSDLNVQEQIEPVQLRSRKRKSEVDNCNIDEKKTDSGTVPLRSQRRKRKNEEVDEVGNKTNDLKACAQAQTETKVLRTRRCKITENKIEGSPVVSKDDSNGENNVRSTRRTRKTKA